MKFTVMKRRSPYYFNRLPLDKGVGQKQAQWYCCFAGNGDGGGDGHTTLWTLDLDDEDGDEPCTKACYGVVLVGFGFEPSRVVEEFCSAKEDMRSRQCCR